MIKISIFSNNVGFWQKFRFFDESSIVSKNFRFLPSFCWKLENVIISILELAGPGYLKTKLPLGGAISISSHHFFVLRLTPSLPNPREHHSPSISHFFFFSKKKNQKKIFSKNIFYRNFHCWLPKNRFLTEIFCRPKILVKDPIFLK